MYKNTPVLPARERYEFNYRQCRILGYPLNHDAVSLGAERSYHRRNDTDLCDHFKPNVMWAITARTTWNTCCELHKLFIAGAARDFQALKLKRRLP